MSIVRLGPNVVDIRGSVGGVTYSRTRAGIISRARVKPIYRQTARQNFVTSAVATLTATWKSLAMATYRPLWNALAERTKLSNAVGETFTPSGFNLFIRACSNLLLSDQAIVDAAPETSHATGCPFTVAYTASEGFRVSAIGAFDDAGTGSVICYIGGPFSQARNYYRGPFSVMVVSLDTAFDTLPLLMLADTACVADMRYAFRFVHVMPDGSVSPGDLSLVDTPSVL